MFVRVRGQMPHGTRIMKQYFTLTAIGMMAWVSVAAIRPADVCPLFVHAEAGPDLPGTDVDGVPKVTPGTPPDALRLLPDFYQTPSMPFIIAPGERVIALELGTVSAEDAQKMLDSKHAQDANAVVVASANGVITVTNAPLTLTSRTCLIYRKGARITAAKGCSASELVLIKDAECVSMAPADVSPKSEAGIGRFAMDGGGGSVTGVRVESSGKVHLDGLAVTGCGGDGVSVTGRGATRYADGVSLARSVIKDCGGTGVKVRDSVQFIALDDRITGSKQAALDVDSPSAILANNICAGGGTGILFLSKDGIVTRNQVVANNVGIALGEQSQTTLVYENAVCDNRTGMDIRGRSATISHNIFANARQLSAGGKDNLVLANKGLVPGDLAGLGVAYFNPPTVSNPHAQQVIWKGEGEKDAPMKRHDITVESGAGVMDVKDVEARLFEARKEYPGNVIVAVLKGSFVVRSEAGLRIPDNTCVLLYGGIANEYDANVCQQMVRMDGRGCAAFSGGKLSSKTRVFDAVSGSGAKSAFALDGVRIDLASPDSHSGAQSTNAVSAKKHSGAFVVRGCEIRDPGARGVWAHVSSRVYAMGNRFYGGGMTIDFDAFCNHSAALYNSISGNNYHSGIFFEEGVKFNSAFANRCCENGAVGIAVHNQEVKGVTENNTIACNVLSDNGGGKSAAASLSFTGRTPDIRSGGNYAFNNRISRSHGRSKIYFAGNTADNYIAQSVLDEGGVNILNRTIKPPSGDFTGSSGFASPKR